MLWRCPSACIVAAPQVPSPCALLAGGKEAKAGGAKKQQQSGKAEQIRLKNLVRSNGCEGLIVHACMHVADTAACR